jgi:hypothetical protein
VKYAWDVSDTPPAEQDDLRHSVFSRKVFHDLTFREAGRGRFIHIAVRYENAKGEGGPWSNIIKTIVP